MAKKIFHDSILYNKGTNLDVLVNLQVLMMLVQVKSIGLNTGILLLLDGLNEIMTRYEFQVDIQLRLVMFVEIMEIEFSLFTGR